MLPSQVNVKGFSVWIISVTKPTAVGDTKRKHLRVWVVGFRKSRSWESDPFWIGSKNASRGVVSIRCSVILSYFIHLCYHNWTLIIPTRNLRVNCSKIKPDDTERSFLPKNAKPRCKLTSDAPKPTSPLICLDIHLWASSVISTFRRVNATICFNLWLGLVENPMGFEGHLILKQFSMDVC